MEFVNKMAQRFVKKALPAVTDSVKVEAKKTAVSILPTLIGLGFVVAGFSIFKSSMVRPASTVAHAVAPALSKTSIVTNNWFLGEAMTTEVLEKIINKEGLL